MKLRHHKPTGLVHLAYEYVPKENNIEKIYFHHRGPTVYNQYGYDDIDRLTTVAYHNSDTEGFVMDDLGNRTGNQTLRGEGTVNFAVDTLTNRYTAVAGNPLAYDDDGNLTQDKDGYQFTYDYENRIIKVRNSSNALVAEFDYDTQGRRIRVYDAVADSTTLYYYSDNWQVLSTYVGGSLDKSFVFGNYIDEVLLMNDGTDDYFYLHDHLYSPVALLDDDGDVLERYEYDAYGKVQVLTSNFSPLTSSQYGNPYAFTGRELDTLDAGNCTLMHYRHRDYEPWAGRFFQQDPHGINPAGGDNNWFSVHNQYKDSVNLTEYVSSHVLIKVDPYGLSSFPPWSPYPGSGYYPGFESDATLRDFLDWFRKTDCTSWENYGGVRSGSHSQRGCRTVGLFESIGPILEIIGGPAKIIIGIAGEIADIKIPVCDLPMSHGYTQQGQTCVDHTIYERTCERECCQFGRRRPHRKTVKIGLFRYGQAIRITGTIHEMKCSLYYPLGITPDMVKKAIDKHLDCDKILNQ